MKLTKLVVASHNDGKVAEIKALLAPLHIEVQSAKELRLGDVEETGKTFEENAKIKANALSLMCGLPCLADDSGLCIDALDGRPGVYSARYAPDRDFKQGMDCRRTARRQRIRLRSDFHPRRLSANLCRTRRRSQKPDFPPPPCAGKIHQGNKITRKEKNWL